MRKEALYLGHLIDEQGIRPDPSKTKIISEWPESRTITQLQSFLGLCNYYRGFVPQFSHIALPLTRYLEGSPAKNSPIKFDDAAKKAFAELKEKLVTAPILAYPNFEKDAPPFILDTDWVSLPYESAPENQLTERARRSCLAVTRPVVMHRFTMLHMYLRPKGWKGKLISQLFAFQSQDHKTIGGVLSQKQPQEPGGLPVERVIAFASRKLNHAEANYSSFKGELSAVLKMCKNFRYFLKFRRFLIRTDHQPLTRLHALEPVTRYNCIHYQCHFPSSCDNLTALNNTFQLRSPHV